MENSDGFSYLCHPPSHSIYLSDTALSPFQAVESLTSIRAGASDATGLATGQGIAFMHGPAKVKADHIMPAWSTCRDSPTNAKPDQILDSESSTENFEDIVQVLQHEICVTIFTSGEALVHPLSF